MNESAVTMDLAGQTHYFCSEHCLQAFEVDPERYRAGAAVGHAHAGSAACWRTRTAGTGQLGGAG